ncbi:MAG TPA: symmetrical bis(5'-nucleosyl)-tetraphosphatase [Vicinamibacteria bacterium]|nr:symmetrical bis(5'-nucleosyl)-tetraphosphatase [Vicinamibacteria bacterium]
MATYAIGDIQGCFITLQRLLKRIDFDPSRDRLWLAGDLVNRGPQSLEVLRWAKSLGPSHVAVLGNHDLHLVARAEGVRRPRPKDTLDGILEAPDGGVLIEWLARRPLLHREGGYVLVHAGLHPSWSLAEAEELALEAEQALQSRSRRELLEAIYGDGSRVGWSPSLQGGARLRAIVAALTRIRTVSSDGEMNLRFKRSPAEAPEGGVAWFERFSFSDEVTVVFGHWTGLGLHLGRQVICIDTGCVWGGSLTALRLSDRRVFQEPSELARGPRARSS